MTSYSQIDRTATSADNHHSFPWFRWGLAGVFLVSLALRFWGLGRFNTLVFDEVYFPKFASNYLKGIPLFEGHPPLSTYILAIGIWIGEHTPLGDNSVKNGLTGLYLSPISYRWLNALTGSFIPLVIAGVVYQLSHRRSYALIAATMTAADGLFLVESRYGLINVYLVLFGLIGHWAFLTALNQPQHRQRWLLMAGIFLGAAPAIKWNGLGYLLGIYLLWAIAWVIRGIQMLRPETRVPSIRPPNSHPLQNLRQLSLGQFVIHLALVPALIYYISWIPFIQLDPSTNFWQWQAKIIDYHHRVGGMSVHPYCSPWYSWMVMWRPVAYFYKTAQARAESVAIVGPPLPEGSGAVIYDVHAMGNPILWWLSSAAVLVLIGLLMEWVWVWLKSYRQGNVIHVKPGAVFYRWTCLYLVVNWATNLLPWLSVSRCTFLYHYMESLLFSFLALALLVDRWLWSAQPWHRAASITTIALILLAFVFWLPMFLGLPLSPGELTWRRWLPSWI
jgi:dolichyl-phosphate-mannose-protein mannosyltransferase